MIELIMCVDGRALTIPMFDKYLTSVGWSHKQDFPNKNVRLYLHEDEDGGIIIPGCNDLTDYERIIKDALSILGDIEGRPAYAIYMDIIKLCDS